MQVTHLICYFNLNFYTENEANICQMIFKAIRKKKIGPGLGFGLGNP
jgi:hypothetical protein